VTKSQNFDNNCLWQLNALKNGCYTIVHKNSGYLLKGSRLTQPYDICLSLGKQNDDYVTWSIQISQ
jgi:hypothetical protein